MSEEDRKMKHNHVEEILLIIAAHACVIYNMTHMFYAGLSKLTAPFHNLVSGNFSYALIYCTPVMFYILAIVIFVNKEEILWSKKKQVNQKENR